MPRITTWDDPELEAEFDKDRVIVYPTDTVFGLGGSIHHPSVLDRIFNLKDRPPEKTVPVLIHRSWLGRLARVSRREKGAVERFWPGGLTLVLEPREPEQWDSRLVREGRVALREPGLKPLRTLLRRSGPVVGTSANRAGKPPPHRFGQLDEDLLGETDVVVREPAGGRRPSTVAEWVSEGSAWHVHREGPVSPEALRRLPSDSTVEE